jgi:hypothetical protein
MEILANRTSQVKNPKPECQSAYYIKDKTELMCGTLSKNKAGQDCQSSKDYKDESNPICPPARHFHR